MDNRDFRDAMGKFTTGITIVTAEYDNEVIGMTVNAFMSVSLEPRLIAISIDEGASMYDKLQEVSKFGVNILSNKQQEVSMYFARQIETFPEIKYISQDEVPVIKDSLATLSCHIQEKIKAGDHMIFIAEVTAITQQEGKPVLYMNGDYHLIN